MNEQPLIAILLSTFNGSEFLAEQLDSLLGQSYSKTIIVARDDGSHDDSADILLHYANKNPSRFHLVEADNLNRGASASFSWLIKYVLEHKLELGMANAYMMFCDQDDIWQPLKTEQQVSLMLQMEKRDANTPILIHSDLRVVTAQLEVLADSLLRYQGLDGTRNSFRQLLLNNVVTGCTMLINERLARLTGPIPEQAVMHDWWLSLVAAAYGRLGFIPDALVDYRQHANNTLGAREYTPSSQSNIDLIRKAINIKYTPVLFDVAEQAGEFLNCFHKNLTVTQRMSLWLVTGLRVKNGVFQRVLYRVIRLL